MLIKISEEFIVILRGKIKNNRNEYLIFVTALLYTNFSLNNLSIMEQILSTKQYIQRYILLKISNGDWGTTKKLPSEGSLAIRFSCSRLTVRNILQNFVYNGLLNVVKGKGYFVTSNGSKGMFLPTNQEFKSHHQIMKTLDINQLHFHQRWINELEYEFQNLDLTKNRAFEKTYFNKKNEKVVYELSILNKEEVLLYDEERINRSLVQYLIWQGIMPSLLNSTLIFEKGGRYGKIAKELGWGEEYPVIISVLTTNQNWIEITLKIVARHIFKFRRSYKVIM